MKAAVLARGGDPLEIRIIPEPPVLPGSVKVKVERAHVPSFAASVLSANMPFPLPTPYTPGPSCVGIIEEVADDVCGLSCGQRVLCGPHFTSGVNGQGAEEILIGWFGLTPGAGPLMERWKNGAFAEKAVYPTTCVTPLGEGDPDEWIKLAPLCILYGGLLNGELRPGQTLLVNGATGNLGAACVIVALAMGASRVFAVGRNAQVLDRLAELAPRRVCAVRLTGEEEGYAEQIGAQAGMVDVVIDMLGYLETATLTLAALSRLRPKGTAVFMGGVLADIPISYLQTLSMQHTIRGSFMHPPHAASELLAMQQAGILDPTPIENHAYPLQDINTAIAQAPTHKGLSCCTISL